MRYERIMRPARPSNGPARLLAVSVCCDRTPEPGAERAARLSLSRWAARLWRGDPTSGASTIPHGGGTAEDFAPLLSRLFEHKGTTWIVSDNAIRDMTLLGIWDMVDSHSLYLSGDPVDAAGKKVCRDDRYPAPSAVLTDPPVIVTLRQPGRQGWVKFMDIGNWGFESESPEVSPEERAEHIERDLRAITSQLYAHHWDGLRSTASGQAMSIWTEHYWTHAPYIHVDAAALSLEAAGVFGGRGECWRIGRVQGPLYQLDVSGMYSYLASKLSLPLAHHTSYPCADPVSVRESGPSIGLLARVTVETDEPAYPYRGGWDVIYPVGRFTTVMGGAELEHAVSHGRVVAWHEGCTYALAPFLHAVMTALRKEWVYLEGRNEFVAAKWIKRVANSLVGRLAHRESDWVGYPWLPAPFPWGTYEHELADGEIATVRVLGWNAEISEDAGFAEDAVPAANIWITAAGRQMLWRLMQTAGLANVAYCYTDELWVSEEGYERLAAAGQIVPGEWGKLRIKAVHDWAEFHGINTYRTPSGATCAGIPRQAGRVLTRGDQYRVADSPLISARIGAAPAAIEREYVYNPGSVYEHGRTLPGGRVEPWTVRE